MIVGMEIAIKRRSTEIQHTESFLYSTIPLRKVKTAGMKVGSCRVLIPIEEFFKE